LTRRILIVLLSTLSALTAAQWARSSLRRDDSIYVKWTPELHDGKDHSHAEPSDLLLPGRSLLLLSSIGRLYVSFASQRGLSLLDGRHGNLTYADWDWQFELNRPSRATTTYGWLAFSFESFGTGGWSLEVPWWFLTVLPSLPAFLLLRRERRARTLLKVGLCPTCGYDLRASKDRCPECGSPIPLHDATGATEKPGDCT
jgi:hypothetical protein